MTIPKRLTLADVTFEVCIEQDDMPVRGNAMCSDDPRFDRQVEDEILAELCRGNVEAWCHITVKATWEGFEGIDSLGACSHLPGDDRPSLAKQVEETIDAHGMREDALAELQAEVDRAALKEAEQSVLASLAALPDAKLERLLTSSTIDVVRVILREQERREIAALVKR